MSTTTTTATSTSPLTRVIMADSSLPTTTAAPKSDVFDPMDEALAAYRAGEFLVVMDDEGRENEGDLIIAASKVTTQKMAWMIKHTRCVMKPIQISARTSQYSRRRSFVSSFIAFEYGGFEKWLHMRGTTKNSFGRAKHTDDAPRGKRRPTSDCVRSDS
jgi:hypothetical protein